MPSTANPFDDSDLVSRYEDWYAGHGRRADRLEKRLLGRLLRHFPHASSALDIGCGTGHFTRWLAERGYRTVGLDNSAAMLAEARKLNGLQYAEGTAEALPFADKSFDLATMITTLEFVADPQSALFEAVRVAAQGVVLGVLNRQSIMGLQRRSSNKPPWNTARLFSPSELKRLIQSAAGKRLESVWCRTTLWPLPLLGSLPLPWGGFIGLAVRLR